MRGHIVKPNPEKRSNLWGFVVEVPRDPITGKRKQKWHSGYKTRKEAQRALADVMAQVNDSTYVEQSRITLAAFLDEWLPSVRSTIRPSTYATYETVVNSYVKQHIGSLQLQAITPLTLRTLYRACSGERAVIDVSAWARFLGGERASQRRGFI